jgi:SAM-dependent methyltransferase
VQSVVHFIVIFHLYERSKLFIMQRDRRPHGVTQDGFSIVHGGYMATHQEIGGMSDDELLQRMVTTHAERYGEAFWTFFANEVNAHLPTQPVVMDLGCGPGLFLRDISARYAPARLYGYDITPAMIDYARQVTYTGVTPTLAVHDLTAHPLPVVSGSVHLVHMTAVLHVLDDPFPVLAEIRRVLVPGGLFVLHDWIRTPLPVYLESRTDQSVDPNADRRRWLRLFPVHNKYTIEDWEWVLAQGGFRIQRSTQVRAHFQFFVTTPQNGAAMGGPET